MPDTARPVMIFAAGRGTRMAPLTDTRPKPLVEVAGRSLLDHALEQAGPRAPLVANTHYLSQMMAEALAARGVTISHEDTLLETGGGLRHALPLLGDGPVRTLNADMVWRGPGVLDALEAAWDPVRMDALLAVVPAERAMGHTGAGDFVLGADGRLTRGAGVVYTGAQITQTDRLHSVTESAFSLNVIWDRMIAAGRLHGVVYQGAWCDVGRPESIAIAEEMLRV